MRRSNRSLNCIIDLMSARNRSSNVASQYEAMLNTLLIGLTVEDVDDDDDGVHERACADSGDDDDENVDDGALIVVGE